MALAARTCHMCHRIYAVLRGEFYCCIVCDCSPDGGGPPNLNKPEPVA